MIFYCILELPINGQGGPLVLLGDYGLYMVYL